MYRTCRTNRRHTGHSLTVFNVNKPYNKTKIVRTLAYAYLLTSTRAQSTCELHVHSYTQYTYRGQAKNYFAFNTTATTTATSTAILTGTQRHNPVLESHTLCVIITVHDLDPIGAPLCPCAFRFENVCQIANYSYWKTSIISIAHYRSALHHCETHSHHSAATVSTSSRDVDFSCSKFSAQNLNTK